MGGCQIHGPFLGTRDWVREDPGGLGRREKRVRVWGSMLSDFLSLKLKLGCPSMHKYETDVK